MESKKKKQQKKKQRRLLLLLLLLVCSGVLFGTTTYAWFTANKTVTVDPIDVNVEAKSGLQISADGETWKSVISNADLKGASATYTAAVNQIPSSESLGVLPSTTKATLVAFLIPLSCSSVNSTPELVVK